MCCCTYILPGLHYMFVVPMPGRQSTVHSAHLFSQRQSSSRTRGFRSCPLWWDWTGAVNECQMPGLWASDGVRLTGRSGATMGCGSNPQDFGRLGPRGTVAQKAVPSLQSEHSAKNAFKVGSRIQICGTLSQRNRRRGVPLVSCHVHLRAYDIRQGERGA